MSKCHCHVSHCVILLNNYFYRPILDVERCEECYGFRMIYFLDMFIFVLTLFVVEKGVRFVWINYNSGSNCCAEGTLFE